MINSEKIYTISQPRTGAAEHITAIIPAYNEKSLISGVLHVLSQVDILDEILVIDDGSRDGTRETVQQSATRDARIRLISHARNMGKGEAVFSGWESNHSDILLLLDADLINLKPGQVKALILPVLEGEVDMTLGLFRHGRLSTDLSHWATPWLSGQRCLRSKLLNDISRSAARGYGLETAITVAASLHRWQTQRIWWEGVSHPPSEDHRGFFSGIANRTKMYAQIIKAWFAAGGLKMLIPGQHKD
jgi:glycosyltransferase involved in cell wall biosynthesis